MQPHQAGGPRAPCRHPRRARTVHVSGKTIIPGLIDGHAQAPARTTSSRKQNWFGHGAPSLWGVTTVHDPSAPRRNLPGGEMQRAGIILGPRTFSSGEIVYGARSPGRFAQIDSYEDALHHVRRLEAEGAHSIKNYNQPRRNQRQQVAAAARAENILVVPEGGSLFTMDMTLIQDGNSTVEHNIPQRRLYEDVLSFWSQTRTAYNPTLVVTYGGLAGDPYWSQRLRSGPSPATRHTPPTSYLRECGRTAPPSVRRPYAAARPSPGSARRSGRIGAHGQRKGSARTGAVVLRAGGMPPVEALRAQLDPRRVRLPRHGSLEAGQARRPPLPRRQTRPRTSQQRSVFEGVLNAGLSDPPRSRGSHPTRRRQTYFGRKAHRRLNPPGTGMKRSQCPGTF